MTVRQRSLLEGLDDGATRPQAASGFARVAVPVPVDGPFTYRVPSWLWHRTLPGMRVRVPFSGRWMTGIVVATDGEAPADLETRQIKEVADCLDPQPLVTPALLALTRWLADTYLVSWGEALETAIPGNLGATGRRRVVLAGDRAAAEEGRGTGDDRVAHVDETLGGAAAALLGALRDARQSGATLDELGRRLSSRGLHAAAYDLADVGHVRVRDEWAGEVGSRWQRAVRRRHDVERETALEATERAPAQRRLVEILWGDGPDEMLETELAAAAGCSASVVAALADKGLVERHARAVDLGAARRGWQGRHADGAGTFELTAAQERALGAVRDVVAGDAARKPVLLHGVTGSGKTEVYLRAALAVVEAGRGAILLVPEIGLTPQLEHRAGIVLGDRVAVLHSGLPAAERVRAWWRVRRGEAMVVVGPRSSVFAPVGDLGLVVIDEEQDAAYKQDERPRYSGRDAALARAALEGATVVLGSATPAVETYRSASVGRYRLCPLPERVAQRSLPEVRVVDMRQEWKDSGRSLLSRDLEEALSGRIEAGEQALLLLNRRGFAAAMLCRACGERLQCSECAVSLTVHRRERVMLCHYCDHRQAVPTACPHCGAEALHEVGHGTERLQRSLRQLLPGSRVGRFDADETRRVGSHDRILSAFARGEQDVLVGTQMLAKGHDFPSVTLVGIVDADATLALPDFRAAERTFQLLTQMAGRAGRGEAPGEVVVQAYAPEHYAVEAARTHDFEGFYERELGYRRRLGYPPFSALIACVCRGSDTLTVKEEADHLAAALRHRARPDVRILGPASPPLARLRGRHRMQVLVVAPERQGGIDALRRGLEACEARGTTPRDLAVDVDPVSLM